MSHQDPYWNQFYEKAWGARAQLLAEALKSEENDAYRAYLKLSRTEGQKLLSVKDDGTFEFVTRKTDNVSPDNLSPTGKPWCRQISFGEGNQLVPTYFSSVDFLLDYLDQHKDFDAIVELGAGFGQNLLEIFGRGGPRNIPYYAGEYSSSGLKLARELASKQPGFQLTEFFFDWKDPDLSVLEGKKNVLIFSCHSIEQVVSLPQHLMRVLAQSAEKVTGFHFEPFGFQIKWKTEGTVGDLTQRHTNYAETLKLNKNFAEVFLKSQAAGEIFIENVSKNCISIEVNNPTSLLYWKNLKAANIQGS